MRCEYGQYISRSMTRIYPSVILCVRELNYEIGEKYVLSSRKKNGKKNENGETSSVKMKYAKKKSVIRIGSLYSICWYAICKPTNRKKKYLFFSNSHTKRKVVATEAESDGREKQIAD